MVYSNSAMFSAGLRRSFSFSLSTLEAEVMGEFMCTVWQKADSAATLATLERKWSSFEVKMAHLALESIGRLAPGSVGHR